MQYSGQLRYHGNMYNQHIPVIVGDQSSLNCFNFIIVYAVRNRAQMSTKRTPTESAQYEEA